LGYSTFSPAIDESYDDEPDLVIRIQKIVAELSRLKELRKTDPTIFYDNYNKMLEIAKFNRFLFYKKENNV
jgi:hypothetical protein